ncbi:MAG TPA: DUF1569 domain-containing protein [Bacteroidota bacterium]|nr:DUF1569 domain-containing protein [Bacteroidota bacterium]
MKTLYDPSALDELLRRIETLDPSTRNAWGKMGVAQMMAHCATTVEVAAGRRSVRRLLIGRLIGPLFRKKFTDDSPLTRNSPTHPTFVVSDGREFREEKERLVEVLRAFSAGGPARCTREPHSFFGALTPEEWGLGMYKHVDHHLRQFGV